MDHNDREAAYDEIDDVESGRAGLAEKAAELEHRAAQSPVGTVRWAELLGSAAELRLMVHEYAVAIEHLELIRTRGTRIEPSAEARLIGAYVDAGRDDWIPIESELRKESADRDLDLDYGFIGDVLADGGHPRQALRWYTMANRHVAPDDIDHLRRREVTRRYVVRQSLGLPTDAYDLAARALEDLD